MLALPIFAATLFAAEPARKQAPTVSAGGVVNAASFVPAPDNFVAPLSIISIFGEDLALRTVTASATAAGRLPVDLGGVTVRIGGVTAPLFYVSPTQINAQVPGELVPRGRPWPVRVSREGLLSPIADEVHVKWAAPGLFAVFLRADYSLVGRNPEIGATPAAPGEAVIVFGTGFGRTNPEVSAGGLPPGRADVVLPWSVWVGGRMLSHENVLYVGQAPRFAGLYQVNLIIPEDMPAGDHEVQVEVAGEYSQAGVILAVEDAR